MTDSAVTQQDSWVADDSTFGARLALIRQRMGWGNVRAAADACGVPAESWRNWERDGMEPRRLVTIAMAIATRTGCDYLWLVHGPAKVDLLSRAENTRRYPTEPRIVARAEDVRHGDGRKTRHAGPAGTSRTSRIPSPRRHGSRPVSRAGAA